MELSNYLELVVRDFGLSILSSPKLINILNDYNAFKNNIAAKLIIQTAISSNYIERFLKIGKYDTHAQLLTDNFSNEFGFKHENVHTVFRAIATALNWDVKAFDNIASSINDFQEKSLMDETLSILKEGAVFCKKDNQILLLSLDGKKSIPSIIPFDYQNITSKGVIVNKSEIFGYEPYDLFHCFEYSGGLVNNKYKELFPCEYRDWGSYHDKYGYNNQGMISFDGKILLPYEYSSIYETKDKKAFYAVINESECDRDARLINSNGELLVDNISLNCWNPWDGNSLNGIIEKRINNTTMYFNTSGERIFQNFDHIESTEDGKYLNIIKNRKYGVADSHGNIIISPIFDFCRIYEKYNLILAILDKKYGLFDIHGSCLTSFNYDDMRIFGKYSIVIVKKDKRFGAINMQGDEIIPCEFEELKIVPDNICYCVEKDCISGKYGVFNHSYNSGPHERGSMVIPCIFESDKIYNAVIAKLNGLFGMYGFNGRKIVDCIYKELTLCINGTAQFSDNKEQGIISCHDRELFRTSFKYRFIQQYSINNRHIAVRSVNCNDKWGLLDARGNEVTEFIYDRLEHISYGLIKTLIKKTDSYYDSNNCLYGLINSYGETILKPEFMSITCISEKLFKIKESYNKYFCCNENGEKIIDDFCNLGVYGNLIIISRENEQNNRDGYTYTKYKYQIYDKAGNLLNPAVYDAIGDDYSSEFVLGLLKVTRRGKIGFINECGDEVIKCEYDDARIPIKIQ